MKTSKSLQVTASTTVINADGQDAARINVYYDKVKLSLDAVAFYDAKSNDVLDLSKFTIEDNTLVYTVTEPGEFSFWVAYKTHNTKRSSDNHFCCRVLGA